ncbi:MAG: hypothetical protein DRQ51_09290 [Gammaproteobacteria bacterium]|nr:MAG: hypothetical protein DRQ51_09290 [Gammaproteobacteria bacterium]
MDGIQREKLKIEMRKMNAEMMKLNKETLKISNETLKLSSEIRYYPLVVGASLTLAIVAVVKIFLS